MRDLLSVSSVKQEKAFLLAIFHVVVAPIIVLGIVYAIEAQWSAVAAISYTLLMVLMNYYRLKKAPKLYSKLKSMYYFEIMKSYSVFMLVVILGFLILVVGG